MNTLTILLSVIGILGTVGTFYFGIESLRLKWARNSITWKEIERGTADIFKKADKDFQPEILLTMSGPGAIITSLAMIQSGRFLPVYTIILEDKTGYSFKDKPKGYIPISTHKWNLYVPEQILNETSKRVMVIDDCVMTGDIKAVVCEFLEDHHFPKENIFFAVLVCSQIAVTTSKAPHLHWRLSHGDFYFPWGKWY
jgi:hypoxanthine phosphoribosyltransferase